MRASKKSLGKYRKELAGGAILGHSFPVPADLPILRHDLPTSGNVLASHGMIARPMYMNKQIDITGGKSLADIFTAYGKVVDKGRRKFTLSFDIVSTLKMVNKGVQISAQDKQAALDSMSASEQAAVARYDMLCKANAQARDKGEQTERWSIVGTVSLD